MFCLPSQLFFLVVCFVVCFHLPELVEMLLTSKINVQSTISSLTGWLFFGCFQGCFFYSVFTVVRTKYIITHCYISPYKWFHISLKLGLRIFKIAPSRWDKQQTCDTFHFEVPPLNSSRMFGQKRYSKDCKPAKERVKLQGRYFSHHPKYLAPPSLSLSDPWPNLWRQWFPALICPEIVNFHRLL